MILRRRRRSEFVISGGVAPTAGDALVQTNTLQALVQTSTLKALIQTATGFF